MRHADVAIVGAGIVGLAHAYIAAKRGLRVVVFERSPRANGASIRNFGLIWPIGQPSGERLEIAMRSRELWLEVLRQSGLPYFETGSLHVAQREDEAEVLREFAEIGPAHGYRCEWLDAESTRLRSPAVTDRVTGGLYSSTEITLDPRVTIARLPSYLSSLGVEFLFDTAVTAVESGSLLAGGFGWKATRILVCSGDDLATLFPGSFADSGITSTLR